jgi:hypothetical protein
MGPSKCIIQCSIMIGDLEGRMQLGVATSLYIHRVVIRIPYSALISTCTGYDFSFES